MNIMGRTDWPTPDEPESDEMRETRLFHRRMQQINDDCVVKSIRERRHAGIISFDEMIDQIADRIRALGLDSSVSSSAA